MRVATLSEFFELSRKHPDKTMVWRAKNNLTELKRYEILEVLVTHIEKRKNAKEYLVMLKHYAVKEGDTKRTKILNISKESMLELQKYQKGEVVIL